eukprot:11526276-Karenia_brevis.AAC.1
MDVTLLWASGPSTPRKRLGVINFDRCIHGCDFRVGPWPSIPVSRLGWITLDRCIDVRDFRVGLGPSIPRKSFGSLLPTDALMDVSLGWALGPALQSPPAPLVGAYGCDNDDVDDDGDDDADDDDDGDSDDDDNVDEDDNDDDDVDDDDDDDV